MSEDIFSSLVGNGPAMQQVKKLIQQVAETDATVLILGESGTGKEVVAQAVHNVSSRSKRAFIPINCGAIPGELLESELFGHEKGAFTGAITARKGRFEMAEKGTIFLDEIGDMPLPMQVKLLRVLQERIYERVGGNKSFQCDIRVVAATHRNLEDNIEAGDFREDLFYRLNVFPIEMPSLRERPEDIPCLLDYLLAKIADAGRKLPVLSEKAIIALQYYAWPGNVRELGNLVERLSILFPGQPVDYEDLPQKYQVALPENPQVIKVVVSNQAATTMHAETAQLAPENQHESLSVVVTPDALIDADSLHTQEASEERVFTDSSLNGSSTTSASQQTIESNSTSSNGPCLDDGLDLKSYLVEVEVQLIQRALSQTEGNVSQAAKLLQTNRTTLVEKIRKYELS